MRLLLDNTVSWRVGRWLRESGHDVVHVADIGMDDSDDRLVYVRAATEGRVLITRDSDFGPIHAAASPRVGVALLRLSDGRPRVESDALRESLPVLEPSLAAGAFVIISDDGIMIVEGDPP